MKVNLHRIVRSLLLASIALSALTSPASAGVYFSYPSAAPLTGAEIVGPVRQSGADVDTTAANLASAAQVTNNTALKALTAGAFPIVQRKGYTSAGDGGAATYLWSASACSLFSGAGDNGLQVAPTTGTGCWNAVVSGPVSAALWGAQCTGTSDDTSAINAGLNSLAILGGGILNLPSGSCGYSSTLTIGANTKLVGNGAGVSILKARAANITAVLFGGNNAGLERLQINCGAAGANLFGACVNFAANVAQILVDDFIIQSPYTGFQIGSDVLITIQNGYIYAPTSSSVSGVTGGGGRGIVINGGNNQQITNVFTEGASSTSQPYAAIEIQSSGQVVLNNNQGLWTGSGMVVDPSSPSQAVTWLFDNQSSYDTGTGDGHLFNATNGGVIRGVFLVGTWTSTMAGNGVTVTRDSNGASLDDDLHFIGHRSYQNGLHGFNLVNGARVVIDGSSACGNGASASNTYDGVKILANMSYVDIHSSTIGTCASEGPQQKYGVEIATSANYVNITGNDLNGNLTSALGIGQPLSNATIQNNIGVDDTIPTVPTAGSGGTLVLPPNPVQYWSGTSNVSTVNGGWIGRQVKVIPTGAFTFVGGGNLGNAFTATINVPFTMTFDGTTWYIEGPVTSVGGYKGTVTATQVGAALTLAAGVGLPGVTTGTIPTCNTAYGGYMVFLTDATSTTSGTTYTGGGSGKAIGLCNGTNWIVH